MSIPFRAVTFAGVLLLLAGCAVGPRYAVPDNKPIMLASPQAAQFGTAADATLTGVWWQVFDDAQLTQWIDAALAHNHDIRQARASLAAARALLDQRELDRWPEITAAASYQRSGMQQAGVGGVPERVLSESWRAGLAMQWEVDLFGRLDRLAGAARARAEASQAELELVRLTIAADVAHAYFAAQSLRQRIALAEDDARSWRETVDLAVARQQAGAGLPEDVENARTNLLRSQAALAPLRAALQQVGFRLEVLAGQRPGQAGLAFGDPPAVPLARQLPLGDVDRLIRNRPDVVQAERLLAASVEDVGAATAELYPRFDLGGFIGFFALRASDFGHAARAFELAPGLAWPALRLGNARARLRGAEALSGGAMARYEQVLLRAQLDVEEALSGLSENQQRLATLVRAARHGATALEMAERRYLAGAGAYLSVLENQRSLFALRHDIALAELASYEQVVNLYKALAWRGNAPGDDNG